MHHPYICCSFQRQKKVKPNPFPSSQKSRLLWHLVYLFWKVILKVYLLVYYHFCNISSLSTSHSFFFGPLSIVNFGNPESKQTLEWPRSPFFLSLESLIFENVMTADYRSVFVHNNRVFKVPKCQLEREEDRFVFAAFFCLILFLMFFFLSWIVLRNGEFRVKNGRWSMRHKKVLKM